MVTEDRMVRVLSTATPEQARLLWGLLAGFVEDETAEERDETPEVQSAAALLAKLDAAMASYAEV